MIAIRIQKPLPSPTRNLEENLDRRHALYVDARRIWVRAASLGYGDDEESQAMRRFFERGNQLTIEALQKRFANGGK